MDTTAKKTDLRVIKTKRAIRNAFTRLLSEKEVADITVTEIVQQAEINRKTFYSHYNGVHELVAEIEDEIITKIGDVMDHLDYPAVLCKPHIAFEKLTEIIYSDYDFYSPLLSMQGNISLVTKISETVHNRTKATLLSRHLEIDEVSLEIMLQFVFSGVFTVYQNWFNSDRSMSLETLARITSDVCFGGINGMLHPQHRS